MKTLTNLARGPTIISTPPHSKKPRRTFRRPANNIFCRYDDSEVKPRHALKRRQLLLASSIRIPAAGVLSQPRDQVSNLADYRKIENAQKLKYTYGADMEVASSLFGSSDPCNGVHDDISGVVSVPSQHHHHFVQARLTIPQLKKRWGGREAELVIEGIHVRREWPFWFDVYIRPADVEAEDEYVGSFLHTPRHQKRPTKGVVNCCLRLGIGDVIDDVDAHEKRNIFVVTLVAKVASEHNSINVENIRIEH